MARSGVPQSSRLFLLSLLLLSALRALAASIISTPSTVYIGEPFEIKWVLSTTNTISLDLLTSDYQATVEHIAIDITNAQKYEWTPPESLDPGSYAIRLFDGRQSIAATEVFNVARRGVSKTSSPSTTASESASPTSPGGASTTAGDTAASGTSSGAGAAQTVYVHMKPDGPSAAVVGGAMGGAFGGLIILLLVVGLIGSRRGWWLFKSQKQSPPPAWAASFSSGDTVQYDEEQHLEAGTKPPEKSGAMPVELAGHGRIEMDTGYHGFAEADIRHSKGQGPTYESDDLERGHLIPTPPATTG